MFCQHKAPHRTWEPDARHFTMYDDVEIPYPDTFRDDLAGRAEVVQAVKMRMLDLDPIIDLKATVPPGLTLDEEIDWRYQRYIKDYLRVVASMDDNIGRLLDYLDEHDLADDTIVVYTSDQGFFLGDHGWFDKRLMYEESLSMPLLIRHPVRIDPGSTSDDIVVNVDIGPTLLDLCDVEVPDDVQGRSFALGPSRRDARRLARVDVLPLLDAQRRLPRVPGALRRSDPDPQADLLLQRPARPTRRPRSCEPGGVGTVRSRRRSAGGRQSPRPARHRGDHRRTWSANSPASKPPSATHPSDLIATPTLRLRVIFRPSRGGKSHANGTGGAGGGRGGTARTGGLRRGGRRS